MGTPKATSILWPHPQTWVPPQLQLNREEDLPRESWEGLPPAPAPSRQRSLSTSYLQYSHPLYPPNQGKYYRWPSPREEAREAVSVCVGEVSARVSTQMH